MESTSKNEACRALMKFYVDEDLSTDIARIGRALGLDIISSHELGNDGLTDPEQLDYAARLGRCIVTGNRDDFIGLTDEFASTGRPHAGVLIVSHRLAQGTVREVVEAIRRYAEARGAVPSEYLCDFLSA